MVAMVIILYYLANYFIIMQCGYFFTLLFPLTILPALAGLSQITEDLLTDKEKIKSDPEPGYASIHRQFILTASLMTVIRG